MNLQLQDHKPLLENQPALPAQVADSMQDILASLQVTPGDSKESVLEAGQPFHGSTVCLVGACACQAQARVRMAVKQMLGEKVEESLKKKQDCSKIRCQEQSSENRCCQHRGKGP